MFLCYRPYVFGLDRGTVDNTPAQTPDMGLAAVSHHTEVVGAVDAEAEVVLVRHVPHRRVHRRTRGTMIRVQSEGVV